MALACHRRLLFHASISTLEIRTRTAWVQKGLNALARGDYPAAVGLFQKAVASDPGEVNYLIGLSNAFIQAGQFADGQHALELGISNFSDPAKQAQLWAALADLHTAWARNLRRSYAYEEAIRQYLAAFEIDKAHRPQSAGTDLNGIGVSCKQAGAYQQAIQYYQQALDWHRRTKNRAGEAETLNNLGESYTFLGQFEKALAYLNGALPIRREVKDRRGEGVTLNNIGNVYMGEGEHTKAIEFFEKALPILHQAGAPESRGQFADRSRWSVFDVEPFRQSGGNPGTSAPFGSAKQKSTSRKRHSEQLGSRRSRASASTMKR